MRRRCNRKRRTVCLEAREIIADAVIRKKTAMDLPSWLDRACQSLAAPFSHGVRKDETAVRAAIISPWSNGQTEGPVTKLVKRQMNSRGTLAA